MYVIEVNASGSVVLNRSYDACLSRSNENEQRDLSRSNDNGHRGGRYRNPSLWDYSGTGSPSIPFMTRGYTGHEHLALFGIINMNGRLYDPVVGRMLAVDNFVQAGEFTQSFNRFSYAFNNPIKYNDPDGEIVPLIFAGAALIGGGLNLWSNWSKVKNLSTALGYFSSGAIGGAVSVVNPVAGGSITAGANVAIDIATGNLPRLESFKDYAKYGLKIGLDGLGAAGSGSLAKLGENLISKITWLQSGSYLGQTTGMIAANSSQVVATEFIGEGITLAVDVAEISITASKVVTPIKEIITNGVRTVSDDILKGGSNVVYQGFDKAGVVRYVGITERGYY